MKILLITKTLLINRLDPDYLNQLIEQASERQKLNAGRQKSIDVSREKIGLTSTYSSKDKSSFDAKRKAHLESISEIGNNWGGAAAN